MPVGNGTEYLDHGGVIKGVNGKNVEVPCETACDGVPPPSRGTHGSNRYLLEIQHSRALHTDMYCMIRMYVCTYIHTCRCIQSLHAEVCYVCTYVHMYIIYIHNYVLNIRTYVHTYIRGTCVYVYIRTFSKLPLKPAQHALYA